MITSRGLCCLSESIQKLSRRKNGHRFLLLIFLFRFRERSQDCLIYTVLAGGFVERYGFDGHIPVFHLLLTLAGYKNVHMDLLCCPSQVDELKLASHFKLPVNIAIYS